MPIKQQRDFSLVSKTGTPAGIGSPGLWKTDPSTGITEFLVPSFCIRALGLEASIRKWANATKKGKVPGTWEGPSPECLEDQFPADSRTIRSGMILRKIEVIQSPGQLSFRIPLTSWEDEIAPARTEWLALFLDAASSTWPLVRFGIPPEGGSAMAEINFSGAPQEVLETLLQPALDSLRWIVTGLAETAEFMTRSDSVSETLEHSPVANLRKVAA